VESKINISGVSIVRVDPVFDNKKLIQALEERGIAISYENTERIGQLEEAISEMKDKLYNTDIHAVFVTYERESDVKTAIEYLKSSDCPLSQYGISPERPKEPADYNWKQLSTSRFA